MVIGIAKWQTRWKRAREMLIKSKALSLRLPLFFSLTFREICVRVISEMKQKGFNYFSTFIALYFYLSSVVSP